jgi:hypothetical protein
MGPLVTVGDIPWPCNAVQKCYHQKGGVVELNIKIFEKGPSPAAGCLDCDTWSRLNRRPRPLSRRAYRHSVSESSETQHRTAYLKKRYPQRPNVKCVIANGFEFSKHPQ